MIGKEIAGESATRRETEVAAGGFPTAAIAIKQANSP